MTWCCTDCHFIPSVSPEPSEHFCAVNLILPFVGSFKGGAATFISNGAYQKEVQEAFNNILLSQTYYTHTFHLTDTCCCNVIMNNFTSCLRHPEFAGIMEASPITMDEGGSIQPFDKKLFKSAAMNSGNCLFFKYVVTGGLRYVQLHSSYNCISCWLMKVDNGRKYLCGANGFWASLFWTPCKGVPINRHAAWILVMMLQKTHCCLWL